MKDEYIYKVKDVCWKCGGSGIDYSKIFSDDYCSRRLCRVCKGKGYTKEYADRRPRIHLGPFI